MLRRIFNSNTGYFLNHHTYHYKGEEEIGYILCRGYVMFGIPGYKKLSIFTNKSEAEATLLKLKY